MMMESMMLLAGAAFLPMEMMQVRDSISVDTLSFAEVAARIIRIIECIQY